MKETISQVQSNIKSDPFIKLIINPSAKTYYLVEKIGNNVNQISLNWPTILQTCVFVNKSCFMRKSISIKNFGILYNLQCNYILEF